VKVARLLIRIYGRWKRRGPRRCIGFWSWRQPKQSDLSRPQAEVSLSIAFIHFGTTWNVRKSTP
jgi:hypothetical protein